MKTRKAMTLVAVSVSIILASCVGYNRLVSAEPGVKTERANAALPASAIPITISYSVPNELNESGGGAPNATMQQAAAFAWQEFIALNWPAVNQTGGVVNNAFVKQRDVPDQNCKFGDPNCNGPLVWETFRS